MRRLAGIDIGQLAARGGDGAHAVQVDALADDLLYLCDHLGRAERLAGRLQAQMPLDDADLRAAADGADHLDVAVALEHGAQLVLVPRPGDLVEDDAGDVDVRLELRESLYQRRDRAGHVAGVDHQDDRGAQLAGQVGGAALALDIDAVEEAHVALDHRDDRRRRRGAAPTS